MALGLYIRIWAWFPDCVSVFVPLLGFGVVCLPAVAVRSPVDPFWSLGCANMFVTQWLFQGSVLWLWIDQGLSRLTVHGI